MIEKSTLTLAVEKWVNEGGDMEDVLSENMYCSVTSRAEANAICAALDALRAEPKRGDNDDFGSPLHALAGLFQQVEGEEAFDFLKNEGLPRLRAWVEETLAGNGVDEDDCMFLIKILAMYRQPEDVDLIARAARTPVAESGFMWSVIFQQFDGEHPSSLEMIAALRDPLPTGFILVAYLDMANQLALSGKLDRHPFDSETGWKQLEAWLHDKEETTFSYARSATFALPFIDSAARTPLLLSTTRHPCPTVRMEAAWVQAKVGDPAGFDRLAELCLNPHFSQVAEQYLKELGRSDRIPERTQDPEFKAVAEMSTWLAHPNEFGQPPDDIELFDTRELFWPPTNDRRRLLLVKYSYKGDDSCEPRCGVGMVGSITFALFGETSTELSPEEIYGIHCSWEMQQKDHSKAPKGSRAEAGREILRRHNPDF